LSSHHTFQDKNLFNYNKYTCITHQPEVKMVYTIILRQIGMKMLWILSMKNVRHEQTKINKPFFKTSVVFYVTNKINDMETI